MRIRSLALVILAGVVSGCITPTAVDQSGQPAPISPEVLVAADRAMTSFYRRNAVEERGLCRSPYFDGILERVVLEDSDQFLRLQVRYAFRDNFGDDDDRRIPFGSDRCRGQNEREFVLARTPEQGLQVLVMTGLTRESGAATVF